MKNLVKGACWLWLVALAFFACNRYEEDVFPARKISATILNDDNFAGYLNQPVRLKVLANDTINTDGVLTFGNPVQGSILSDSAGFFYQPQPNFQGTEQFYYKYCSGQTCDSALVSIAILPDVPNCTVRANPDQVYFSAPNAVTIPVLANDITCGPVTLLFKTQPRFGTVMLLPGNQLKYTPQTGYSGPDTLQYEIQTPDGRKAAAAIALDGTLTCTVLARNDVANTVINDSVTIFPVRNDITCGMPVQLRVVTNPQHGTVRLLANNSLSYEPNPNFSGTDAFTYQICNAANQCSQATISVNTQASVNCITGFTARPDALNFPVSAAATGVYLDILQNDIYCINQVTSVTILQPPVQGTATVVTQNGIPQIHYVKSVGGGPFSDMLNYQVCMLVNGQVVCKTATVNVYFN